MLPSTLRATRGLHRRQLSSSCCARIDRVGPGSRSLSRGTLASRSYATTTANDDKSGASESKPEIESKEKNDKPSSPANASASKGSTESSTPAKTQPNKPAEKKPKAKLPKEKPKGATEAAIDTIHSNPGVAPKSSAPAADPATLEALRNTLAILKSVQGNPAVYQELNTAGRSDKSKAKASEEATKAILSLREQFPSIRDAATKAEDARQRKLLSGVADVLKSVLANKANEMPASDREKDAQRQQTLQKEEEKNEEEKKEEKREEKKREEKKREEKKKEEKRKEEKRREEKKAEEKEEKKEEKTEKKGEKKREEMKKEEKKKEEKKKEEQKKEEKKKKKKEKKREEKKEEEEKTEKKEDTPQESEQVRDSAKEETAHAAPNNTTQKPSSPVIDQKIIQGIATIITRTKSKKTVKSAAEPAADTTTAVAEAGTGDATKAASEPVPAKKTKQLKKDNAANAKEQKKAAKRIKHPVKVEKFDTVSTSAFTPIDHEKPPVPLIQYGLDRVLFNEGVMVLQDPRTNVWNFDPYLANIMQPSQFDFDALTEYITSSKDTVLLDITRRHGKKYTGSTSSMTSTLAHFHFLLSGWREINPARLSRDFEPEFTSFNGILRSPSATFLNYNDGVYAIDADKEWDIDSILSMLGKSMEKLLTVPKDEFEKYRRENSHQLTAQQRDQPESYHYTSFGDFMMRSQLDAYDPRLPGTGVYDLKTRAVVSVRLDAAHHEKGRDYEIRTRTGQWESYEREYYDLIRSAFLKYSMQVRMGRMDGIFVAYHNTQRIFGFQYIPIEEMDLSIHGQLDTTLGEKEFTASLTLLNKMLNEATARFPEQSLRVFVETRQSETKAAGSVPFMYFFAEPVTPADIKKIQERKAEDVNLFRERVLGIPVPEPQPAEESEVVESDGTAATEQDTVEAKESEPPEEEDSDEVWEDIMEVVEQTMDKDAQGITAIRDAIQEALEQSGLLRAKSPEEAQRYIDSLLNSIVDVNETAESDNDDAAASPAETEDTQAEAESKKPSAFSFLTSWFRSSSEQTSSTEESPKAEAGKSAEQIPGTQADKAEPVSEESTTIAEADGETEAITKEVDSAQANLVELILKMTSIIGSAPTPARAEDENEKEDQAKLRAFERVLLELIPRTEDAPAETPASQEKKTPDATPPPSEKDETKPGTKPLMAMVLTVRNVVNGKYVKRPENLTKEDKWTIEYSIEEIADQAKAELLYGQCQARRKSTHVKTAGRDAFKTAFQGMLPRVTHRGREYRAQREKAQQNEPVWIVGQEEPFDPKDVFQGAGVELSHVLPKTSAPRIHKTGEEVVNPTESENSIADTVASLRETRDPFFKRHDKDSEPAQNTSTFKEWREKSSTNTKE